MPATLDSLDKRAAATPRERGNPDEELATFARAQRDRCAAKAADLLTGAERAKRSLLPSEEAELEQLLSDGERWAFRHEDHSKRAEAERVRASVTREPLTYRETSNPSFFRDIFSAKMYGDPAARERLERHGREIAGPLAERERQAESEQRDNGVLFETRVNPSRTSGQGGSFAPPLWLIDLFAIARAPRG